MKRTYIIMLSIFLLFLTGCTVENSTTITTDLSTTTEETTTQSTTTTTQATTITTTMSTTQTTTTTTEQALSVTSQTYDVEDIALYYTFSAANLLLYETNVTSTTKYVNISDFLTFLEEGVINLGVLEYGDNIRLSYFSYYIDFDCATDTITFNDFDFVSYLNKADSLVYTSELVASNFHETAGEDKEKIIDLTLYEIDLIHIDDLYLIPLSLASQILTGSNLSVYMSEDIVYIFDDIYTAYDYMNTEAPYTGVDEQALVKETINMTALIFDHYYGLKDIYQIDSFITEFTEAGFYDISTLTELIDALNMYTLDLDDPHTRVLDYGYYVGTLDLTNRNEDDRRNDIYNDLTDYGYYSKEYSINFFEYEDFYHLDILSFDLDTKDYLAEYFVDLDPDKPIFIDLSANTGGAAIAVYELLSYLTDDPMMFNTYNPQTKTVQDYSYYAREGRALENEFYVFTSNASFSAANLFVSLVKDNDLALVVGYPTSGGACAVHITTLPSKMVLVYSSNTMLLDNEDETIEFGILPDIEFNAHFSIAEAYQIILDYFENYTSIDITVSGTANDLTLDLSVESLDERIAIDHFEIVVYDMYFFDVIETYQSETLDFIYTPGFTWNYAHIYLVVTVEYQLCGFDRSSILYTDHLDNVSDVFTLDTVEVTIGEEMLGFCNYENDQDYYKFVVTEAGSYYVISSIDVDEAQNARFYDGAGQLLGLGGEIYLEPGTYVVSVVLMNQTYPEAYTFSVEIVEEAV